MKKKQSAAARRRRMIGLWVMTVVAASGLYHGPAEAYARTHRAKAHKKSAVHATTGFSAVKHDGIPTIGKAHGASSAIVKRPGVQLTAKQASFVSNFGAYLHSQGEHAVLTSGARTPQNQLSIIKEKIHEAGATSKFPQLRRATPAKSSTWLAAWNYLRARHVPVYAPAMVAGQVVTVSNHLRGLAVDFISGSLDKLSSLVMCFAHSSFAAHSALSVVSVAREPGCVHVNLQ